MCLGIVGGCKADPEVALHLRNAADYRLPTFGPHGTKLGHSWYQWIIKRDFSGRFDNSEKEEVSGQIEWIGGWSRGCTPPMECCRLPPTYFWTTWHQARAFLISVNNKKWFFWLVWQFSKGEVSGKVRCLGRLSGWGVDPVVALPLRNAADYRLPTFGPHRTKHGHACYHWIIKSDFSGWMDNSKKGEVSGQIEWMGGWSRGGAPPKECCRLPPTYFRTTWHQTRAFLISVNNKSDFSGWFDNSKKGEVSGKIEWIGGWSRGCTPPEECCRVPHIYF